MALRAAEDDEISANRFLRSRLSMGAFAVGLGKATSTPRSRARQQAVFSLSEAQSADWDAQCARIAG